MSYGWKNPQGTTTSRWAVVTDGRYVIPIDPLLKLKLLYLIVLFQ